MYSGSSLPYSKFIVDLHKTTYKSSGNHLKGWDRMPKKMLPTLKRNSDAVPWGFTLLAEREVYENGAFWSGIQTKRLEEGNWLKVRSIRSDTPAYEAGIRSGDFITRINGNIVFYMDLKTIERLIRNSGNVLYLDVERNSEKNLLYDNGIKGVCLNFLI
ncbi:cytohesin-interacting protein [Lepeophtheirus salmonis]|uniref:cytohesin-interacting protein n=1 Tax=Lepeophtheirus salmonis TaxID=72036 RepID=UPI001AE94F84|nr:cytohesin-interacting protein-like [Lepeophtheirus salmonis]